MDATLEQGVRVTTSRGSSQFSYEVVDKDALYDWLRIQHGQDLLSDDEISQLLEYTRHLLVLMRQEDLQPGDTVDLNTRSGQTVRLEWEDVTEIERLLWRAGQIDHRRFSAE